MTKKTPIILGIFAGVIISGFLILFSEKAQVYGEGDAGTWNTIVAKMDSDLWDWQDIFDPAPPYESGTDLYAFIYGKLNVKGKNSALDEIAKNYGFTPDEAQAVLDGSIAPFFERAERSPTSMTQEEAYILLADLQDDYETIYEVMQLEQEVDATIAPGEIFMNGDLSDSGFDLVDDLNTIEEILFKEYKPSSIGKPFEGKIDSPYVPDTDTRSISDYYVTSPAPAAILGSSLTVDKDSEKGNLKIGEKNIDVEIVADECTEHSPISEALDHFADANHKNHKILRSDGTEDSDVNSDSLSSPESVDNKDSDLGSKDKIPAAPSDSWSKSWCPGLEGEGASAGGALLPPAKIESIGGISSSSTGVGGIYAGAGLSEDAAGSGIDAGVCLETENITEPARLSVDGKSCVQCEVDKINELMEETLSHTLLPNKITGNLLESAKCKDSGFAFDMQFTVLWNPIPVPVNEDLIYGKNIFEEWNKFAKNYQPLLPFNKDNLRFDIDFALQSQEKLSPPQTTYESVLDEVRKIISKNQGEAALNIQKFDIGTDAANISSFSRIILEQITQSNEFFNNFNNTFKNTDEPIKKILKKGYVD